MLTIHGSRERVCNIVENCAELLNEFWRRAHRRRRNPINAWGETEWELESDTTSGGSWRREASVSMSESDDLSVYARPLGASCSISDNSNSDISDNSDNNDGSNHSSNHGSIGQEGRHDSDAEGSESELSDSEVEYLGVVLPPRKGESYTPSSSDGEGDVLRVAPPVEAPRDVWVRWQSDPDMASLYPNHNRKDVARQGERRLPPAQFWGSAFSLLARSV